MKKAGVPPSQDGPALDGDGAFLLLVITVRSLVIPSQPLSRETQTLVVVVQLLVILLQILMAVFQPLVTMLQSLVMSFLAPDDGVPDGDGGVTTVEKYRSLTYESAITEHIMLPHCNL